MEGSSSSDGRSDPFGGRMIASYAKMDRVRPDWRGREVVQVIGHSAYGGGVPIVFGIMRALAALDLRPVLLATHPEVVAAAEDNGFEVWRFEGIVREPRPVHDLAAAFALARALRTRGALAIHTHTSKGGMIGRLAGRLAGCPLVVHHTHGFYHTGMRSGLKRRGMLELERFFGGLTDYQIFLSESARRLALEEGTSTAVQARVIQNGVAAPEPMDADAVREMRRRWGVPEHAPLIGSVCRLATEQKGLDSGLRAFARVSASLPDARWIIVGEGSDRASLESLAQSLGVADRVLLPGHVEGASRLNSCFDVVFAPSRREGQSISLMEAMACGVPIVTTRILGNEGLVEEGVSALLSGADDIDGLSRELLRALTDEGVAARLRNASRHAYQTMFTEEAFESRVTRFFIEATSAVRPRRA